MFLFPEVTGMTAIPQKDAFNPMTIATDTKHAVIFIASTQQWEERDKNDATLRTWPKAPTPDNNIVGPNGYFSCSWVPRGCPAGSSRTGYVNTASGWRAGYPQNLLNHDGLPMMADYSGPALPAGFTGSALVLAPQTGMSLLNELESDGGDWKDYVDQAVRALNAFWPMPAEPDPSQSATDPAADDWDNLFEYIDQLTLAGMRIDIINALATALKMALRAGRRPKGGGSKIGWERFIKPASEVIAPLIKGRPGRPAVATTASLLAEGNSSPAERVNLANLVAYEGQLAEYAQELVIVDLVVGIVDEIFW